MLAKKSTAIGSDLMAFIMPLLYIKLKFLIILSAFCLEIHQLFFKMTKNNNKHQK